ncbi:MAG TPA: hypothetical protein PKA33_03470 [Amaricoccus sp.]|uniref:hypothetical protein n=1 Tax=Amaricoccus sp. TaxID=1872485 RepID=UPI002CC1DF6D|nr:hypothetical protein [Amaricoccus sp.]HMQ92248.1 hypothetical protein [Amaricoccus sp.]HMR51653.1 hypothetical protein [Amaricoccus sp.]HMR59068.1 hypothetical protein [Amaricoccus sp.]HMT98411.1 hypothetical protein [Amaricoccus sp.]
MPDGASSTLGPAFPRLGGSRNLIVVRAGRASLHPGWVEGPSRPGFDLLVARFEAGPSLDEREGHAEIAISGRKVSGFARLFREHPELLANYDFIALLDDDLRASQQDLERLFGFGDRYGLDLFQPSLSWTSHFSYAACLSNPHYRLRYTNMVEMMCPVFRAAHLARALPLFDLSFETGIDLLWCRLTDSPGLRYAIVDDVVVAHTRPVGSTKHRQGFGKDETYDRQIARLLDMFGTRFRGIVTYAAIDTMGRRTGSRPAIALRSLVLWRAWAVTPMPTRHFVRFLTDYLRHCLWRPLNLGRVDLKRCGKASCRLAAPRIAIGEHPQP